LLIKNLETRVVAQSIECGTIRLPEEAKPGSYESPIGTISALFVGNCREKDGFWGFGSFEILDFDGLDGTVFFSSLRGGDSASAVTSSGAGNLVNFGQGLIELLLALVEEESDHGLDSGD
jgi:hypothetical protein